MPTEEVLQITLATAYGDTCRYMPYCTGSGTLNHAPSKAVVVVKSGRLDWYLSDHEDEDPNRLRSVMTDDSGIFCSLPKPSMHVVRHVGL